MSTAAAVLALLIAATLAICAVRAAPPHNLVHIETTTSTEVAR